MPEQKYRTSFAENYPPERHLLRDLNTTVLYPTEGPAVIRAPVAPEFFTDTGHMYVGIIATLVDVLGGGLAVKEVYPDWTATSDLSMYMSSTAAKGTVSATGSTLRVGKTSVIARMEISEERDGPQGLKRRIGSAIMKMSRFVLNSDPVDLDDFKNTGARFHIANENRRLSQHFTEEIGIRVLDRARGEIEADMSGYIRNRFGALQGGITATLVDMAGQCAARASAGKPLVTRDLSVHYISLGKAGPFRTTAEVQRVTADTALSLVEVRDMGAGGRLMAVAMHTATL